MFSQSLGRAVRTTPPLAASTATVSRVGAATIGASAAHHRSHARRLSSNNAASPPGDGHRGSPAPASTPAANRTHTDGDQRPSGRLAKKKARETPAHTAVKQRDEAFANVPSVPSTTHLKEDDVKISSFFALHRPISVTMPYPPQSGSSKSFDAIFDAPKAPNSRINDTIYTLNHAISSIEGGARRGVPPTQEEREARMELLQQQSQLSIDDNVYNLDGHPPLSLEQMIRRFKPFNTPPAPVALEPAFQDSTTFQTGAGSDQGTAFSQTQRYISSRRRKVYATTMTIEESIRSNGEATFTARCGPIRRIPTRRRREALKPFTSVSVDQKASQSAAMAHEGNIHREMLLISVKRQRKLKMKKKKYKKLMRKTRTLRRKLGRD